MTHLLRISDTSIASLDKTVIRGKSIGKAEIQVIIWHEKFKNYVK